MLLDFEKQTARVVRSRGYEEFGLTEWVNTLELPMMDLLVVNMETGIIIEDTWADPRWYDLPETHWIRSYAGAPIRLYGRVIGVLNLDSATPGFFTQKQADSLQAFADQAAIAIQNAQLYDQVRRHALELEQHVAERTAELEQERAQLQAIVEAMSEGLVYDEGLQVRYINQALSRLTGYTREEYASYLDVLRGARQSEEETAALAERIYHIVDREGIWQGELRLQRKDGTEFDAALTATAVLNSAGEISGAVTIIRDISREKALQAQKDRFITHAAHELRTPISVIKTRLYLLGRRPGEMETHLRTLGEVTDQITDLVEELLQATRLLDSSAALARKPTVLQSLIADVITARHGDADRRGIQVVADIPRERLRVLVDPQAAFQALNELALNALRVTPDGGQVHIRVVECQEGDRWWGCIDVCDQGDTIPPDLLPQVFDPFFRATVGGVRGTGLGLTIAKRLVEMHGGTITVDRNEPGGNLFSVRLPLST
jgi:PAS domain S-box-containing protein